MTVSVDHRLLAGVQSVLAGRAKVYWIIGGSGAGKSTVCREIGAKHGIPVYDMDEHVFTDYPQRCTQHRHPAISAWFTAPDSFAWMLGLPEGDFIAFNQAATAEFLDLLAGDLAGTPPDQALLVDGWVTDPDLLVQAAPPGQIACLEAALSLSAGAWEEDPDRQFMKEMIGRLPDPAAAWRRFLSFDALMSRLIHEQCQATGIRIFRRDERTSVGSTLAQVVPYLGIDRP